MAMLSMKLVALVEDHWEQITTQVIHQIRQDTELMHLKAVPETDLREAGRRTLKNLGTWLEEGGKSEVMLHYEEVGRTWSHAGVPIHEVVRGVQIIRARLTDFIREQGISRSTIDVYAEEELEYRITRFFDSLVYHIIKGCETK